MFGEEMVNYKNELENLGLNDRHITESTLIGGFKAFWIITLRFIVCIATLVLAFPGALLNFPIGITARYLAEKHRKESLASSEVKIEGMDVVASKKVTIAMILTPPLYILYSGIIGWYYGRTPAILTFFGLFALAVATIRFAEEGIKTARSLGAIFKIRWIGTKIIDLSKKRKQIQTDIRDLVTRLGPELFGENQDKWRIIKEEQFDNQPMDSSRNVTGRFDKPYKAVNPWESPIISDKEWEHIQEIFS